MKCNHDPIVRGHSTSLKYTLKRNSVDRQEYARCLEAHLDLILDWVRSRSAVPLSSDQNMVVDDAFLPEVEAGLKEESLHTLVLANRRLKVLHELLEKIEKDDDWS